ncbi:neuronal-specific septin-3 isoform X1 [Protopterus annectens]|uniref:neuronal-specific septin-3 isoform X1 n=1 Tax=Protopterus annectens TaxID=7888 RepID=UPI001CFA92C8|nr:neuronal-specific septin-3 isoform X1 [Protopterus annectens]
MEMRFGYICNDIKKQSLSPDLHRLPTSIKAKQSSNHPLTKSVYTDGTHSIPLSPIVKRKIQVHSFNNTVSHFPTNTHQAGGLNTMSQIPVFKSKITSSCRVKFKDHKESDNVKHDLISSGSDIFKTTSKHIASSAHNLNNSTAFLQHKTKFNSFSAAEVENQHPSLIPSIRQYPSSYLPKKQLSTIKVIRNEEYENQKKTDFTVITQQPITTSLVSNLSHEFQERPTTANTESFTENTQDADNQNGSVTQTKTQEPNEVPYLLQGCPSPHHCLMTFSTAVLSSASAIPPESQIQSEGTENKVPETLLNGNEMAFNKNEDSTLNQATFVNSVELYWTPASSGDLLCYDNDISRAERHHGSSSLLAFQSSDKPVPMTTDTSWVRGSAENSKSDSAMSEMVPETRPKPTVPMKPMSMGSHLLGYVGIDTIIDQMRRKTMKTGFDFNIMVVGQSGLGKSTLVNTLFKSQVSRKSSGWNRDDKIPKTVDIKAVTHVIEEGGVKMKLTVIDTPGFGDQINNENCWEPIEKYINEQYEKFLKEEVNIARKKRIPDTRVHCCLYFISPTGHSLRPLDIEFMKHLNKVVNIIPVIAKADTMTPEEKIEFKQRVRKELEINGIEFYPQKEFDEDMEDKTEHDKIRECMPFAVVGSDKEYQVNGKRVLGRKTPWGIIEVENIAHCEFALLRDFVIRTHLQDLKEVTHNIHYETYRAKRLNDNGGLPPVSTDTEESHDSNL